MYIEVLNSSNSVTFEVFSCILQLSILQKKYIVLIFPLFLFFILKKSNKIMIKLEQITTNSDLNEKMIKYHILERI